MSRMRYDIPQELGNMFETLDRRAYAIVKKGLFSGAELVADEIRKNTPKDGGDLADSLFIARFTDTVNGSETVVGFAGYDKNGKPNPLKAAVLESGTHDGKKKATHFFSKAVRSAKEKSEKAIEEAIVNEIKKETKG